MWKPFAAGALAAVAVVVAAAAARADTHLDYQDTEGKPASQVYVKDGKVRVEPVDAPVVVYDTAADRLTTIDPATGTYTVLDRPAMERIGDKVHQAQIEKARRSGRLTDAQERVLEEVAHMAPEQRALLEQMVGGLPGVGPPVKIEIGDLGTTQRVAGHDCADAQLLANGMKLARMCVADLDTLGLPGPDRAALQALHDGIQGMKRTMGTAAPPVPDLVPKGLALRVEPGNPDLPRARPGEVLHAISVAALPDALFQVPAGYTEQPYPEPQ
jgi:hypothetical protein